MIQDILNMEGESVKRRHDLIPVSKSVLLGIDLWSDLPWNGLEIVSHRFDEVFSGRQKWSGTLGCMTRVSM